MQVTVSLGFGGSPSRIFFHGPPPSKVLALLKIVKVIQKTVIGNIRRQMKLQLTSGVRPFAAGSQYIFKPKKSFLQCKR